MNEEIIESSIGKFPKNWNILPLNKISTIVTGTTPKTVVKEYYDGDFPWITPSDINSRKNIYDSPRKLTSLGLSKSRVLPPNTLLITCIASIGKNAILRKKGSCNQQINAILPSDNHDVDFLYYVMNYSTPRLLNLAGTTAVALINKSTFSEFEIALPPIQQQQRIAEILNTVDEKIEVIEQQIIETQELKKGLMQRLLTKGIGHTEFKDSPLGMIPKSWDVVKIEDIAEVKGGKRLPKGEALSEFKTAHPYIRVADMYMGGVSLEKILYVPENIFPVIKNYTISKDDLFISVAGTLGLVGQIPEELNGANLTENADKLTNIKINKSFLLQVLLSPIIQNAVNKEQTNNAQPKLALTRIKTFEITKPPAQEQQKIANILNSIDEKLEVLAEKKIHYKELKQGLMQQLLTGKIRVTV